MVQLRTLGRLELLGGEPSALRVLPAQPKPLALLAYLAVAAARGAHRRETLLALFWPDLGEEEARRALRQALHRVRHHVGDGLVLTGRDGQIELAEGGAWCDAVAFEQALDAGRPADALLLYQGTFLEGIFVADASAEFEQWVDLTRTRLGNRAAAGADTLAAEARRSGDREGAVRWSRRASELAPEDEPRVRTLMQALADIGDRRGALHLFQAFADRLKTEYDAAPAAESSRLAEALRITPPASGVGVVTPPSTAQPATPQDSPVASGGSIPVAPSTNPPLAAESSRSKRRVGSLLMVLGLAAALVIAVALIRSPASSTAVDGILVGDFRNHTRDSLLAGAVAEALRVDLSQSHRARVMTRTQVQTVLELMRRPNGDLVSDSVVREIAERYGVKAFITGDVASLGSSFTVSAELISVKGGEILASVRESAPDSTGLLRAVDRVSSALRRGVGESLWSIRSTPPLEQVTTSSLEALRLYSEAIRVGDQEGDDRRAVVILQRAVALDTTFAMAYRKLGVYLRTFGDQEGAEDALAHAFRFRKHLPELESYHTAGSYYANASLIDSAIATYHSLLAVYPNDTRALNNLADSYEYLREFSRAESLFHRAVESDSSIALIFGHLATAQFNGGHYADVERTLAAMTRRFPPQLITQELLVSNEMMRGQFDSARGRTEKMLEGTDDEGSRAEVLTMMQGLAIVQGRLHDADRYRHSVEELRAPAGLASAELELAMDLAFVDIWYRHDPMLGLALLDSAIARHPLASLAPLSRSEALLAYTYALGGRPARARELLAEARASEAAPGTTRGGLGVRDEGTYLRALGVTELAEGHAADAVRTLHRSDELSFCPVCSLPDLAHAFERAGQPDSAIAVYERYVTTPWSEWPNAGGEYRGSAYERLAPLLEARGDTLRAIKAYDRIATLWSGADAELQPLVENARRRSAALQGKRGKPD
ncbi:MAG: FlgO family outer membrane protein [Gemmatimonadota bacterium]